VVLEWLLSGVPYDFRALVRGGRLERPHPPGHQRQHGHKHLCPLAGHRGLPPRGRALQLDLGSKHDYYIDGSFVVRLYPDRPAQLIWPNDGWARVYAWSDIVSTAIRPHGQLNVTVSADPVLFNIADYMTDWQHRVP
jgi:hypothetical protein